MFHVLDTRSLPTGPNDVHYLLVPILDRLDSSRGYLRQAETHYIVREVVNNWEIGMPRTARFRMAGGKYGTPNAECGINFQTYHLYCRGTLKWIDTLT